MSEKLAAGAAMPEFTLSKVGGGEARIGGAGRWQLLVVYRGKHCPICKRYLGTLEQLKDKFAEANVEVLAVSADPKEKAEPDVAEMKLTVPVAYDLSVEQMRKLGLYVSEPRSPQETDRPFAEPGLFAINPEGKVQILDISNAPFARPDLQSILNGISFVQAKGYPIRGTLA